MIIKNKVACNVTTKWQLVSTGSCRADCFRFVIDGAQVGWIPPHVASLLTRHPEVFSPPQDGAVSLCATLDSCGGRSEAVDAVLQALRQESSLTCLKGWRDEVRHTMPLFWWYFLTSMALAAVCISLCHLPVDKPLGRNYLALGFDCLS